MKSSVVFESRKSKSELCLDRHVCVCVLNASHPKVVKSAQWHGKRGRDGDGEDVYKKCSNISYEKHKLLVKYSYPSSLLIFWTY